jgi:hypothetical protein
VQSSSNSRLCYLNRDSRAGGELTFDKEKRNNLALQAKLDSIMEMHISTAFNLDSIPSKHGISIGIE